MLPQTLIATGNRTTSTNHRSGICYSGIGVQAQFATLVRLCDPKRFAQDFTKLSHAGTSHIGQRLWQDK